ncbi:fatty acid desaturase family protein [Nakamurella leprariae]|uniref:Acyl-CoA desaturase n=1 Tax=Nakamurella leprariae TaxID=2803911 RepID=A0A939C1F1_9ACTN|nr:acyl-CoA desaturase [Nakamurella leprariae]MBM9467094.1 acyl-CoA desaturase [Nakamurella leprariae]
MSTSVIADPSPTRPRDRTTSDYAQLLRTVQEHGLLGRRLRYYWIKGSVLLLGLAATWVGFFLLGHHWAQLGVAAGLAVVLTQIVFLSHDAAHQQIFRSRNANDLAALVMGTGIGGVSLSWWNNKHSKHHAAPNHIGKDSDISPSVVHFYPAETPPRSRLAVFLHEHQGWWFFPLLVVEMLNLHAQSVIALLTRRDLRRRKAETALLSARLVGYPAAVFVVLPVGMAAAFLGVQLAISGLYLGSAFAASHIGMPVVPADSRIDFLRRQVLLSRNISGGGVASLAMGGLNYQIEHHLFPNMPRPNLHRVRPIVQRFCAAREIPYQKMTITRAWATVAGYLNRVGLAGRDPFQCPVVASLR